MKGGILDYYVPEGDSISYENIKEISWRIVGNSEDSQVLTVYDQTPNGDGQIIGGENVDLIYDIDDGKIIGLLPLDSQEGDVDFDFMVTDLNGHSTIISFEIADYNVSPSITIDDFHPQPFEGVRYFKPGEKIEFTGHIETTKSLDSLYYYIYPEAQTPSIPISYIPTLIDEEENIYRYDFSTPGSGIDTSSFENRNQIFRIFCKAAGVTEPSHKYIDLILDDEPPEFDMAADPVTSQKYLL